MSRATEQEGLGLACFHFCGGRVVQTRLFLEAASPNRVWCGSRAVVVGLRGGSSAMA